MGWFLYDIGLRHERVNDIDLDDDIFDNYDPETIIHATLMAWYNRYKQHKKC